MNPVPRTVSWSEIVGSLQSKAPVGSAEPHPLPLPSYQDYRFNQDAGADKYLDWKMESFTEPPPLVCLGEAGSGGIELFMQPLCLN